MLDFLLKKHPEFLKKFREYSKEEDVFCEAVDNHIKEKEIEMYPLSEEIKTTYGTNFLYNGDDFEITFSDSSNFILAENTKIENDGTKKAHIFIFNKIGRTKMNCHICDFKENPFPLDFIPTGIGAVEHFFCDEEKSIIHELRFGTWERTFDSRQLYSNSILNLFPSVLKIDAPAIEIKFIQDEKNTTVDIQFNSGNFQNENFHLAFRIDKRMSEFLISASGDGEEIKKYIRENHRESTQSLINDSISEWLSQSIDLKKLLYEADSEEIKITYEQIPTPKKIHLKLEELEKIEKCDQGESRARSNPNQKIRNPEAGEIKTKDWIIGKRACL